MKGLTNQPKWLVFCLGREGKKKSGYPFRLSRHGYERARPAKSPATRATHQHRPARSTPSGGLFSSQVHIGKFYSKLVMAHSHPVTFSEFFLFCSYICIKIV